MDIRYLGQSCFHIHFGGKNLLFDPFISPNELAKDIDIESLEVDYILLTHGHADHVADTEAIAKRTGATVISNFEIVEWYGKKGINGHPMNHGGKFSFDFGMVKYVNAIHSSTMPDGSTGGNPGGFVLWNDDECIYHAGDTALTYDMKLIPMFCPKLDAVILPLGDNFTMGYEEAALAAEFVECNNVIGCHYDTFGYIEIDHKKVGQYFEKKGLTLTLPKVGEHFKI